MMFPFILTPLLISSRTSSLLHHSCSPFLSFFFFFNLFLSFLTFIFGTYSSATASNLNSDIRSDSFVCFFQINKIYQPSSNLQTLPSQVKPCALWTIQPRSAQASKVVQVRIGKLVKYKMALKMFTSLCNVNTILPEMGTGQKR